MAQVVDVLKPHMVGWKRIVARGDWALHFPAADGIAFGLVTFGRCELRLHGHAPIDLSKGDYILMPKPSQWKLRHGDVRGPSIEDLPATFPAPVELGSIETEPTARLLGGYIGVDPANVQLIGSMLEPLVVMPASSAGRIAKLLDLIDEESSSGRPAASPILDRLLEIMLIEALRFDPGYAGDARRGLIAGLGERGLAAALRAIHAQPAKAWTVATLAAVGGMSRSLFAERFEQRVGTTPIDYLLRWRMALARRALRNGKRTTEVAHSIGYGSAGAFSAAFRRVVRQSPDSFRGRREPG